MAEAEGKEAAADVPSDLKENVDSVVESAPPESVNSEEETVMVAPPEEEDAEDHKENEKIESVGTDVPECEKVDEEHKTEEVITAEEVKADEGTSASNKKTKKLRKVKKKAVASAAARSDKTEETSAIASVLDGKAKEEAAEKERKENGKVESVGTDVPEGGKVDEEHKMDEEHKTEEAIAAEEVKADEEGPSATKKKNRKLRKVKKKAVASDKTEEASAGAVVVDGKAKEKTEGMDQRGASTVDKKKSKMADGMGLIFMCNAKTKMDCFHYKVLGLPASKKELVEKIYKGMRLFLFDIDLKLLYGIYKAASPGGYNLEPKAFKSGFPSQVRFSVLNDCLPLPEEKFKAAIKENYYGRNKFNCQLSAEQVKNLCKLFTSASKIPSSMKRSREATRDEPEPASTGRDRKRRPQRERARKDRTPSRFRGHDLYSRREAYASPLPQPVAYVVPSTRLAAVVPPPPFPSYVYDRPGDYRRELLPSVDPYVLYREPLPHHEALYARATLPYASYASLPSASSYAPQYPRY